MRTREEIEEVLNQALDSIDSGTRVFPALSYADGVEAGLNWVLGQTDSKPMDD